MAWADRRVKVNKIIENPKTVDVVGLDKISDYPVDRERILLRRRRVIELRKTGMSLAEIADTLTTENDPVTTAIVSNDLRFMFNQYRKDMAQSLPEVLSLELQTLDDLQQEAYQVMESTKSAEYKLNAIEMILKVQEKRHKLFGLDAPHKIEQKNTQKIEVSYVDDWRNEQHGKFPTNKASRLTQGPDSGTQEE